MNSQSEENRVISQIHLHPAYDSGCNQIQLGMFQSVRDAKLSVLSGMNFLDIFLFMFQIDWLCVGGLNRWVNNQ